MNIQKIALSGTAVFLGAFFVLVPTLAFAKSNDIGASCSITVTTSRGTVEFEGTKNEVMVSEGDTLNISWIGDNALSAKDGMGIEIPTTGTTSFVQTLAKKTYIYRFKGDTGKTTNCAFTAYSAKATFDIYSLTSTSKQATLRGTATGLKKIVVAIKKDTFSENEIYRSNPITVKNGMWSVKIPTSLEDGTYQVNLYAPDTIELGYLVTGTLTMSSGGTPSISFTQDSVIPSKSLVGGNTVVFAKVKLNNTSNGIATINAAYLKRVGTADDASVIGLSAAFEGEGSPGFSGGSDGYTPFNAAHLASIPFGLTLKPGETRVLTLSASISKLYAPYNGKTLGFEIYGFNTGSVVKGTTIRSQLFTLK